MRWSGVAACVALSIGASAREGRAQAPAPAGDSAIGALLEARVRGGHHAGLVVGILDGGRTRVIVAGSAGPGRPPLSGQTLFEIGSISKAFTATLLAEMAQRGEVRLDQPVDALLPAGTRVPAGARAITLEDLATHRSGLPRLPDNLAPRDPANPYADYDAPRLYDFLRRHTLRREPGAQYEYSNLGAGLLGHALALRAGERYDALLRRRVLEPLGLRDTRIAIPPADARRFAAGHDAAGDTVPGWDLGVLQGAGALRSTADDMLRFLRANLEATAETPLGRAMLAAHEPRATVSGQLRIALGWHVRARPDRNLVWHNGGTGGFSSFAGFDRARQRAVVVLSNTAASVDDIGMHLLDPEVPYATPAPKSWPAEVALDSAAIDRLVGEYRFSPTFAVTVVREGDRIYIQPTGQGRARAYAESPTALFLKVVAARLTFERDTSGRATVMLLHQNGAIQRGTRVP